MSNLPTQSAVIHNDDDDESSRSTNPNLSKRSTVNSRITSPLIIKRQQTMETKIANNQAYDEIHDLQAKQLSMNKFVWLYNDNDRTVVYDLCV
jgi:beta-xylosidase